MAESEDDFSLAGHPERLPGQALDHQRIAPEGMNLGRKRVVLRFERLDLLQELLVLLPRFPETQDPALAEQRVEHRRCEDEERGESEGLTPEAVLDETAAPGRRPGSPAFVVGARSHAYQTV